MQRSGLSINSITDELIGHVAPDVQEDLRTEDIATAVQVHFPDVGLHPLPHRDMSRAECSTDGYCDFNIDPNRTWIFYADDVNERRARFTILHELGHHLLMTSAAGLLDSIDQLDVIPAKTMAAEEAVCHCFAGRLLVPDVLLAKTIGNGRLLPEHIRDLHDSGNASWEAVAVRVAGRMHQLGAVVLVRDSFSVFFCSPSPVLGWLGWPRGSKVEEEGPLSKALTQDQSLEPETYRFGLSDSMTLQCDTISIQENLAIGVLSQPPSQRGRDNSVDTWEPVIKYCTWCFEELNVGWCDKCKGRFCSQCERCACTKQISNPMCPSCHMEKPFRKGADVCRDCE
ncbi:MAG: ImmA/IrrE family metallo-endopeptidase [Acidimicrobiales bacterium]